jgi:hypothetical protein
VTVTVVAGRGFEVGVADDVDDDVDVDVDEDDADAVPLRPAALSVRSDLALHAVAVARATKVPRTTDASLVGLFNMFGPCLEQ